MKKLLILMLSLILSIALVACVGGVGENETEGAADSTGSAASGEKLDEQLTLTDVRTVKVDPSVKHQTIESFGASGAWWAQTVGGNESTRDRIAKLLFDPEDGIGLNSYRYNIGAGSQDIGSGSKSGITDHNRRAYSFEKSPGEYDWSRDANAVWFMNKAAELGADEIVMFCNSPLERLTKNGRAYGESGFKSNLAPGNYEAFAKYTLDVAEHFKSEGLPIKYVSPINEPAFEWSGGQEGSHYEDSEVIAVLKAFVKEIGNRPGLDGVRISSPEGSSWRNAPVRYQDDTLGLCLAIMRDDVLGKYFTSLDAHSYWSDTVTKKTFAANFYKAFPNAKLRQTEWCEMEHEKALTIDSGITLAEQVHEDMTILDCVSWSFWTAVSFGDYRDGLIYTDGSGNSVQLAKRYYTLGNYSRYIDRGYERIDAGISVKDVMVSAYEGTNENGEKETVLVFINKNGNEVNIDFSGIDASVYNRIALYVTDKSHSLSNTYYAEFLDGTAVSLSASSVTTVVISAKPAA